MPRRRAGVVHAEPGSTFAPVWILAVVTAAGFAVVAAIHSPGDALSIVLIGVCVGLGGVGPYVFFRRRHGRLQVTKDCLRIGLESFALAELDPGVLEEQAAGQRYTGTPSGWFGDRTSEVRVAGGQWGEATGDRYVVIKVRGQNGYRAVGTIDPPHLAQLLIDLLKQVRGRHWHEEKPELASGTFRLTTIFEETPRSARGDAALAKYEGPHGPAFVTFAEGAKALGHGAPASPTPNSTPAPRGGWTTSGTPRSPIPWGFGWES